MVIQADKNNLGPVYIGDAGVQADYGLVLYPGESMKIAADDTMADEDRLVFDLAEVYVDAANNNDKVNLVGMELVQVVY